MTDKYEINRKCRMDSWDQMEKQSPVSQALCFKYNIFILIFFMLLSMDVFLLPCSANKLRGECGIKKNIVSYLYIQESEGQMGGMRSILRTTYLSADGAGQLIFEGSDDTAEQFETSQVECKTFLNDLENFEFPRKEKSKIKANSSGTLVTEYSPALVYIEIFTAKGRLRKWSCSPKELPKEVVELIKKAKDMVLKGDKLSKGLVGDKYIRSSILTKAAVEEMIRAEIIEDISPEAIEKQSFIYLTLTHPRMLIPVPESTNPYKFVKKSFQRGRSVQLSIGDMSFQIRNITKPKQKEEKK